MRSVSASEFKQRCLALLDEIAASGEPIVVTKRGKAVAQLSPLPPGRREDWRGAMRGRGEITGDLIGPVAPEGAWETLNP